jgi:uncharacterized Ntn-hydrolase superfamily protein
MLNQESYYLKLARLASTFSIVAFDPSTKNLGVAVQSRYFSVGPVVPWAEAGVGAIATQSFVNVSYGPKGLQLLKEGLTVQEVIDKLTSEDEGREYRQLGIIDANGNAAAYTGKKCLDWAGSKTGKCYSAQGNILAGEEVVKNMGRKFEATKGDLADKLMAALEGGEEAGGDARGRQSAAILTVGRGKGRGGYGDRLVDLRVEDHVDPIAELRRLLKLHRVYYLIDEAEERLTAGNTENAISTLRKAIELNSNSDDAYFELGMMYMKIGEERKAIDAFKHALQINPKMKVLINQLSKLGEFKISKEFIKKIKIRQP